jgi:hypothetical protein
LSTRPQPVSDLHALNGVNFLVTHPDYEPAYIEHASRSLTIRLGPLKATQRVLVRMPNAPSPQRRYPRWVSFVLALVPLSAALAAFWWQRKRDRERKAFLEQWETHLDFEPIRVHTRSEEEDLFQAAEVATLARELRRRRPEPTSQLAVESTVCKTVERGGIFTPVRRQRQGSREYLVLLESKGGRDQQASFWNCLLEPSGGARSLAGSLCVFRRPAGLRGIGSPGVRSWMAAPRRDIVDSSPPRTVDCFGGQPFLRPNHPAALRMGAGFSTVVRTCRG